MRLNLFAAGLVLATMSGVACAQVVNINVTSGNGPGTAPLNLDGAVAGPAVAPFNYVGSSWNDLNGGGGGFDGVDLLDSEGNTTAIAIDWDPAGGNANGFSFSYAAELDLLNNYWASNNGFGSPVDPSTITFSGLGSNTVWDIYFIAQGDTDGQGSSFTIDGLTKSTTGANAATTDFVEDLNFVLFEGIQSDTNGEILTIFDDIGSNFQILNGIQLVSSDTPPQLLCDVNGNGVCNSTDYAIIRDALFTSVTPGADGDLTGDGFVDFADFRRFKDDPNRVIGADPSVAVPEPASFALVGLALLAVSNRRSA